MAIQSFLSEEEKLAFKQIGEQIGIIRTNREFGLSDEEIAEKMSIPLKQVQDIK